MFFNFVSFLTNHGFFFLICLENIVYDDVLLWQHGDFKDEVEIFLRIF